MPGPFPLLPLSCRSSHLLPSLPLRADCQGAAAAGASSRRGSCCGWARPFKKETMTKNRGKFSSQEEKCSKRACRRRRRPSSPLSVPVSSSPLCPGMVFPRLPLRGASLTMCFSNKNKNEMGALRRKKGDGLRRHRYKLKPVDSSSALSRLRARIKIIFTYPVPSLPSRVF